MHLGCASQFPKYKEGLPGWGDLTWQFSALNQSVSHQGILFPGSLPHIPWVIARVRGPPDSIGHPIQGLSLVPRGLDLCEMGVWNLHLARPIYLLI